MAIKTAGWAFGLFGVLLLAACQETGARPTAVVSSADSADQVLEGFSHFVTNQGVRRSRVEADTAFFYEASQTTNLRNVRVVFFDLKGAETSTLTARRGKYLWQDGSMEAHDNVVVVTPDGRRLASSMLKYDSHSNLIWTNKPFTFDRAGEHLEGNSFKSDPDFRNVDTDQPRGASGKGMLLPGQSDTMADTDTSSRADTPSRAEPPQADTATSKDSVP